MSTGPAWSPRSPARVSRAGCNIEGIDIDHETEDRAVLVLVLTDEGDLDALVADLAAGDTPRRYSA